MNKKIFFIIIAVAIIGCLFSSCPPGPGDGENNKTNGDTTDISTTNQGLPLNISVFVDLSDRIVKESDGMRGLEKDTAIVRIITDFVSQNAFAIKIKFNKDHIKVFFYPVPTGPGIATTAEKLDVNFADFDKAQIKEKQAAAGQLTKNFNDGLKTIYDAALADGNFIGSDIWGFFNTQAQKTCVMEGYRNVLVIITDGYIYHKDNLVEDKANKQATYITKTTLAQGYTLTPIAGKISNLEVLVVELNPDPVTDFAKMESAISDWFKAIGISRYEILKTDLPANSKKPIIDFLNP